MCTVLASLLRNVQCPRSCLKPLWVDFHVAFSLLCMCGSHCKLIYLARTTPPSLYADYLKLFDGEIRLSSPPTLQWMSPTQIGSKHNLVEVLVASDIVLLLCTHLLLSTTSFASSGFAVRQHPHAPGCDTLQYSSSPS